ncbi:hypothetical protein Tco_1415823 [Tanacetum coccineum]
MELILENEDAIEEDRGLKRQKTSKDTKPSKKAKSIETSKGTSKSTDKSAQVEETMFEVGDTQEPHNQGQDMGNNDDQPNVMVDPKHDWFKKPERPPTPDSDWNLMSTPIDFSPYVMNHLKIDNLTQEHLVGPPFNLLKRTCKSHVELEYNIEECYIAVTDRLD